MVANYQLILRLRQLSFPILKWEETVFLAVYKEKIRSTTPWNVY